MAPAFLRRVQDFSAETGNASATVSLMISYRKLADDSWGLSGEGSPPSPGTQVVVQKRDGTEKQEIVGAILKQGKSRAGGLYWIATKAETSRPRARAGRTSEAGWRDSGCSECRRLQNWCPRCAFDEFDN